MPKKSGKQVKSPTGAMLSKFLRIIATDLHTTNENGDLITKAAALAKTVWDYALGFEEADPDDPNIKVKHAPQVWAVHLLYDRIEGRAPDTLVEDKGLSVKDKVSALGRAKANSLAKDVTKGD